MLAEVIYSVSAQRPATSEARERVVNAALELFLQRGFADVSMQQIADDASITKATLYHHFRDKQDLYLAVMRKVFTQNFAEFFERIGENGGVRTAIREMLVYILTGKRSDVQRLMADFGQHIDEETQQKFWAEYPKPWVALEPIVQRELSEGTLRSIDAEFAAKYIYSATAGYAHVVRMSGDSAEISNDQIDQFTDMVLNGIVRQ